MVVWRVKLVCGCNINGTIFAMDESYRNVWKENKQAEIRYETKSDITKHNGA